MVGAASVSPQAPVPWLLTEFPENEVLPDSEAPGLCSLIYHLPLLTANSPLLFYFNCFSYWVLCYSKAPYYFTNPPTTNVSASPILCLVLCEVPSRDMHRLWLVCPKLGLACSWLCPLLALFLSHSPLLGQECYCLVWTLGLGMFKEPQDRK